MRRIAVTTGALGSALAAAALVNASITAYRAVFETRVTISIASELSLFATGFKLAEGDLAISEAPAVTAVTVAEPRILKHRHPVHHLARNFVEHRHRASTGLAKISGVGKLEIAQPKHPEPVLTKQGFTGITLAAPSERDNDEEEGGLDTQSLAALLQPRAMVAKAEVLPVNTQTAKAIDPTPHIAVDSQKQDDSVSRLSAPLLAKTVADKATLKASQGDQRDQALDSKSAGYSMAVAQDMDGFEDDASLPSLIEAAQQPTTGPPSKVQTPLHHADTSSDDHVRVVAFPGLPHPAPLAQMNSQMDSQKQPSIYYSSVQDMPAVTQYMDSQSAITKAAIDVQAFMQNQTSMDTQAMVTKTDGFAQGGVISESNAPTLLSYFQPYMSQLQKPTPKTSAPAAAPAPAATQPAPVGPPAPPMPSNPSTQTPPTPPSKSGMSIMGLDAGTPAAPPTTPTTPSTPMMKAHALDAILPQQPTVPMVTVNFGGHVFEAFTGAKSPVEGATVQILGTQLVTQTDTSGTFAFPGINVDGVLPIVITKQGYLKRRVELRQGLSSDVELVSENSLALSAVAADDPHATAGGILYGQIVNPDSSAAESLRVEIVGPGANQPVYIDTDGKPNRGLSMTSSRGQFMFLNLVAGTYLVTITDSLGRERAPHVIYIGDHEGVVRKFNTGTQTFISGHVYNAASFNAPVSNAQIQLLGASAAIVTGRDGSFTLGPVYVDCAASNYLHVEKAGFYRNRIDYGCDSTQTDHSLYAFPAGYVDGVASDAETALKPTTGVVIGHASFKQSIKMQLWGPEEVNPEGAARGNDYYFDTDGVLNPDLARTTSNGNFAILNAPEGISYIQSFSQDGNTLSFWPIFTSASTVNAYMQ